MNTDKKAKSMLADYLHRRLDYLRKCDTYMEKKLFSDDMQVRRKVQEGVCREDDPAVGSFFFYIDYIVGNTFRYTMLVAVCSFLEEAMREITKRHVKDYDALIKAQRSGNWLRKHVRILCDGAGLDIEPLRSDLDKFYDLITLRNCIVHCWGKLAEAIEPSEVKIAAERIPTAEISANGYLVFGDQVFPEAITASRRIAQHILSAV